jgi:acetyl-CoA carboxylase biotin carboxyl carrier protein
MDAPQIKAFVDAMAASDLAEMEVAHDGWTLRLVRRPGANVEAPRGTAAPVPRPRQQPVVAPAAAAAPAAEVLSPLFGVVHLRPSPGSAAFVAEGQPVRAGQTVCVIEAMKVFHEVQADRDGVVDAMLVASGVEVEAGQPLLRLR